MTYRVRIGPVALHQIDQFAGYLRDYSEDFAIEQIERLDRILRLNLGEAPLTWSYFPLTGAPYRAYLFRVGRRTNTGSSIRSTRMPAPSISCRSGTRCAIRKQSTYERAQPVLDRLVNLARTAAEAAPVTAFARSPLSKG